MTRLEDGRTMSATETEAIKRKAAAKRARKTLRGKLRSAQGLLRRVAEYVGHTEEPGEVCTDNCLRCAIDAAIK